MAMIDTLQAITHTVAKTRNPNVWMDADVVFRKLAKPTVEAGLSIQVPIKIAQHPVETYQGLTPSVLDTTDFQRYFNYEWKLVRAPMVYDGQSILKNNGNKQALVKLVTSILENSEDALTNKMVTMFFGSQTDAGNDFNSFQHLANDATGGGNGLLGTGLTLGGLSKITYPRLSGHALDAGGGTHGPVYANISNLMALLMDGSRGPDMFAGNPMHVLAFAGNQQGNQRFIQGNTLTAGFMAYECFGVPFYAQRHVPAHPTVQSTNRLLAIDTKALQCYIHADRNFIIEPFEKLQGQDGWASYRLVAGNFTTDDPGRLGVMYNFDGDSQAI